MALVCSASTPVSMPRGIVVVHDCITRFLDDVIELDDTDLDEPKMRFLKNHEIELNASDGYGMGMPSLMERWGLELGEDYILPACVIRNSFCKGSVVCVDFQKFACDHGLSQITDVWGNTYDIREVELVLTESMLKLWDSYTSLEAYLDNCAMNHYSFAVTKTVPYELENVRTMNYQFLQSYDFTDDEIDQLLSPTVTEIQDILSGDYRKTILYVKGTGLNDRNVQYLDGSFATALMIDKRMWNDPFVQDQIRGMLKKRIDRAKVGVLTVPANYSLITGDPYALCQSMFGLKVTGLLKKGQIYSKYWVDRGEKEISSFRAPMTSHNNIRLLEVVSSPEMEEFYKYIVTPTVFNCWDTCAQAMNGFDFDGDCVINTSYPLIVNNTRRLPAICCVQRKAPKCIPTDEDFMESNIRSFGNAVGSTTNKITSMFEVQSRYTPGSREYNLLDYRIKCGQLYQQNSIDKTKGIDAKPFPASWYNWISNKITTELTSAQKKKCFYNRQILAEKKPYFMRYIYPQLNNELKKYIRQSEDKCYSLFLLTIDELINKENKTTSEKDFLENYYNCYPVGVGPCIVNRICWKVESLFDGVKMAPAEEFDYTIMKSDAEYSQHLYKKIETVYKAYLIELKDYNCYASEERIKDSDSYLTRLELKTRFKRDCLVLCPNEEVLCNIILDMCYSRSTSKRFAWDICGETIIKNLLMRNGGEIKYPTRDPEGEIEFGGERFTMKSTNLFMKQYDEVVNDDYFE